MFDEVMARVLFFVLVPLLLLATFLTGIKLFYEPKQRRKDKARTGEGEK